ncbi:MAG: hypothetical protein NPIRA02_10290 [Nitrospirales bacterium]|nr:MAG: hypothetical protein NPIRA02_10290 [Nitrospirales bacterium]
MEIFPGVSMDSAICSGKPCLTDTSVDIATIVGALGTGQGFEGVQESFQVTYEQVLTALRYASYVTDHLPLRMPAHHSET